MSCPFRSFLHTKAFSRKFVGGSPLIPLRLHYRLVQPRDLGFCTSQRAFFLVAIETIHHIVIVFCITHNKERVSFLPQNSADPSLVTTRRNLLHGGTPMAPGGTQYAVPQAVRHMESVTGVSDSNANKRMTLCLCRRPTF